MLVQVGFQDYCRLPIADCQFWVGWRAKPYQSAIGNRQLAMSQGRVLSYAAFNPASLWSS